MTTTSAEITLKPCQCGDPDCTEMVPRKYARGHWAKAQARKRNLTPLPGPDDAVPDDEDLPDELVAELDSLDWLTEPHSGEAAGARAPDDSRDDPPAARIPPSRTAAGAGSKTRTGRVTATIRRDVEAKIRFIAVPAGRMWRARDPFCGGTFCEQEPEISASLAEIVCDSPDLLNFFTGTGGAYMKYVRLFFACLPVGMAVSAHHIGHQQPEMVDGQQPQQQAYAA